MTDAIDKTTMYVKSIPKAVSEDIGRCAKRETPEPMTLAGYIEHVHGFYQARKGVVVDGGDDRAAPGGLGGGFGGGSAAAEMLLAKAAFFESLAAVTEKVRGNGAIARHVRNVVIHQLGQYAPPPPPPARRVKALAGPVDAE